MQGVAGKILRVGHTPKGSRCVAALPIGVSTFFQRFFCQTYHHKYGTLRHVLPGSAQNTRCVANAHDALATGQRLAKIASLGLARLRATPRLTRLLNDHGFPAKRPWVFRLLYPVLHGWG